MTNNPPPPRQQPSAAACGHCFSSDRWILHNVRHQNLYRKLCTSCVLKLHPTSFCPTCFSLHDAIPPSPTVTVGKTLTCFKCSSLSHITCVPQNAPKSPYLCPPCTNPNYKFFEIRKPKSNGGDCVVKSQSNGGDLIGEKGEKLGQFIDEKGARVFLAAAKVAAMSMNKAVASAKAELEKKVKESNMAKKRAKEAIDHLVVITSRLESLKNNDNNPSSSTNPNAGSAGVKGPNGTSTNPNGVKGPNVGPRKVEKNGVVSGRASNGGGGPPEIKNVGRSSIDGPVVVVAGARDLETNGGSTNNASSGDDKKNEGGEKGKDGIGA